MCAVGRERELCCAQWPCSENRARGHPQTGTAAPHDRLLRWERLAMLQCTSNRQTDHGGAVTPPTRRSSVVLSGLCIAVCCIALHLHAHMCRQDCRRLLPHAAKPRSNGAQARIYTAVTTHEHEAQCTCLATCAATCMLVNPTGQHLASNR